jgi:uncharacterized protein
MATIGHMSDRLQGDVLPGWLGLLRRELPDLRTRYAVRQLWLFGPAARGEPATAVDLLATFDRTPTYAQFTALQADLAQLLGIKVELVIRGDLDPAIEALVYGDMIAVALSPHSR